MRRRAPSGKVIGISQMVECPRSLFFDPVYMIARELNQTGSRIDDSNRDNRNESKTIAAR